MRLGQLARRLEINTKDIVAYLEKEHDVSITNHPNSKLPDEVLNAVVENFKPSPVEEMTKALETEEKQNTPLEQPSTNETIAVEEKNLEQQEEKAIKLEQKIDSNDLEIKSNTVDIDQENKAVKAKSEDEDEEEQQLPLNIVDGVIKAPKLEIEGIKVVGKIDLPEPKQPEKAEEAEESENDGALVTQEAESTEKVGTGAHTETKRHNNREKKNTHTTKSKKKRPTKQELEARRLEREEKQKREEAKRIKAKKKAHYEQQLAKKEAKAVTLTTKKKANTAVKKKSNKKAERPSSLWGKFMYWLNDK